MPSKNHGDPQCKQKTQIAHEDEAVFEYRKQLAKRQRMYASSRYETFEYDDETSASDPKGRWQGGSDYYARTYRCRVPKGLLYKMEKTGDEKAVFHWIENHADDGIWLD